MHTATSDTLWCIHAPGRSAFPSQYVADRTAAVDSQKLARSRWTDAEAPRTSNRAPELWRPCAVRASRLSAPAAHFPHMPSSGRLLRARLLKKV